MLRRLCFDVPTLLSVLYAPLQPLVKRLRIVRRGDRRYQPNDVLLPPGYGAEVVATGLTAPVHASFGPHGAMYVTESGHKSESPPRIFEVDPTSGSRRLVVELSGPHAQSTGAATGTAWHDGSLIVTATDAVLRVDPETGVTTELVDGLPGLGDHQTNHPVIGPDGRVYWGQGCVTNMGVVGADNFGYEWLAKFRDRHDVPGGDIVLAGRNYEVPNVLGNPLERLTTGAYVAFGTATEPNQRIPGSPKASGAVLSCLPDGSDLRVVAWGLRNPYGIAVHPDGRLFVTEHGSDERGARWIVGDPDDLYEIREGAWYGWPDFASGIRLDDPHWGPGGTGREPVLAEFPDPEPPKPVGSFEPHAAANGFDFSRDPAFGFEGQAFVALFGDLAPVTTPRQVVPAGFKLVRVDPSTGAIHDFAVNRIQGPASKLFHGGFERPSHCVFGSDGALYVVDFGEIKIAPEKGGIRMKQGTGSVWRISRVPDVPAGDVPPSATRVPFYPIQAGVVLALVAGGVAAVVAVLRRLFRR
ncbi:MAG TPA: PQQ-dependent sugar dehydrogenase [Candidatus Limnocylindria bacterium]|nr:PQQ-dependent sugar dehydrogenase [Candidatus Limnocylindria bacterium]